MTKTGLTSFLILIAAWVLGGCGLHLHDPVAAKRSVTARDAWSKVNAEPNLTIALKNLEAIAKDELKVVEDQERVAGPLAIQDLATKMWTDDPHDTRRASDKPADFRAATIEEEVTDALAKAVDGFQFEATKIAEGTEALKGLDLAFKKAANALAQAERAVKDEAERDTVAVARAALKAAAERSTDAKIRTAHQALTSAEASSRPSDIVNTETQLEAAVKTTQDDVVKLAFEAFDKARRANPRIHDLDAVVDELRKARDDLGKGESPDIGKTKTLASAATSLRKLRIIVTRLEREQQPGLRLVMLGVALDVATAERDRLAEQQRQAREALRMAERRKARLELVVKDAAAILNVIRGDNTWVHRRLSGGLDRKDIAKLLGPELSNEDLRKISGVPYPPALPKKERVLTTLYRQATAIQQERTRNNIRPVSSEWHLHATLLSLIRYTGLKTYPQ